MPWFRSIFLIKIVSAVFEIFRKKEGKKTLFSCTITILDHTLYGKVKIVLFGKLQNIGNPIYNIKVEIAIRYQK